MNSRLPPPRSLKPSEPTSISAQFHRHLRASIIRGEILPGQVLSELEIARHYSVSRQPVREAFIKLAEERLVVIQPQRGTVVVKISIREVLDSRFVRESIELAVALEAAEKASSASIHELRSLIEQQKILPPGRNEEFLVLDDAFHRAIALSVGRAHAWRVIGSIKAPMDRIRFLSFDDAIPIPKLIEQHERITDAIEAGDCAATALAIRTHLQEIQGFLPMISAKFPDFFENEEA